MSASLLALRGLSVAYQDARGDHTVVVDGVDLDLEPGRILGLAGETGCGKSTTALAAIGFPIPGAVRLGGSALLDGVDLLRAPVPELRRIWGRSVAYVAQEAALALSPLRRVEWLIGEPLRIHLGLAGTAVRDRVLELLMSVGIPDPEAAARRYPHEFSGGQQQRIAIAIAMACGPRVLVLDEPTTGLDVTTQAQILALIRQLIEGSGATAMFISHDLSLLATVCDRLAIMYAGEVVESGPADAVFAAARHPYAAALLDAVPRVDVPQQPVGIAGFPPAGTVPDACAFAGRCRFVVETCRTTHPELVGVAVGHEARCLRVAELGAVPRAASGAVRVGVAVAAEPALLAVRELRCDYPGASRAAVDGVSLRIGEGETLAVVGESGSGKTTLLRAVAGLHARSEGQIAFAGTALASRAVRRSRRLRREIQLVFQNPHASLNPRHTIRQLIERPLTLFQPELDRTARRDRVLSLLSDVRLRPELLERKPHQLSGGQKQRVALARAFAAEPRLILCDEVVSALDVSVQASILELLSQLATDRGTALLFVTHDLALVRSIADRVCVMRDGQVVESGTAEAVFEQPSSAYTRELLAAVPRPTTAAPADGVLYRTSGREW